MIENKVTSVSELASSSLDLLLVRSRADGKTGTSILIAVSSPVKWNFVNGLHSKKQN